MKRVILALALASASFAASALPPPGGGTPLNVNVTNPVVPVEVRNADPVIVREAFGIATQPFRKRITKTMNTTLNEQAVIETVPAGKRLVLQHVSWNCSGQVSSNTQIVFAGLRANEFGPFYAFLEINPPHASASSALTLQDGSAAVSVAFEAGEEVWFSASRNNTQASNLCEVAVNGYWVTL